MKFLLATLFIFIAFEGQAKTYSKMFNTVYRNNLQYSSFIFLKLAVLKNEKVNSTKALRILDKIHPSIYIHDENLDKLKYKKTILDYAVGVRSFFQSDYRTARNKFNSISKKHPMYLESQYLLGILSLTKRNMKKASIYFNRCVKGASLKKRISKKNDDYIQTFKNRCVQQLGRVLFTAKKFKSALKIYDSIDKKDFVWPRLILDKAWANYWLNDKQRSIGGLLTFNAPVLRRFLVPEANYLRALNYYDMCYFEKADKIIKDFNQNTWAYRNIVKNASTNKLYKMAILKKEPKSKSDKFLYYYLKGFRQDVKYFTYFEARKQLSSEIRKLSRISSLRQARVFLEQINYYNKVLTSDFKDFLNSLSKDYYSQIYQMQNAFGKLKLMVNLNKRKNLRKKNKVESFNEIDISGIKKTRDKLIWDFQGGYWADELGDYAVALKSRCRS